MVGLPAQALVESGVLEGDRRVAGEHLEQTEVALVELADAELGEEDHAGDVRAVAERDGDHRLVDRLRSGNLDREVDLERVRGQHRLPGRGHVTRDTDAELDPRRLHGLLLRDPVTLDRDRDDLVSLHEIDAAGVVVDQAAEL